MWKLYKFGVRAEKALNDVMKPQPSRQLSENQVKAEQSKGGFSLGFKGQAEVVCIVNTGNK